MSDGQKASLVAAGLGSVDRALQLKPEYIDAIVYKGLLLRSKAGLQADTAARQALIAEADALRDKARKLRDVQDAWNAVPPNAVRIGGGIAPPAKIVDVRPVYPASAKEAKIQGVVIVEVLIGDDGKVRETRVRRSVPQLDAAAVDAVRKWEFTPTKVNGQAVPVVMTTTVNFVLDATASAGAPRGVVPPLPPPPPPPPPPPGDPDRDPAAVRVGGGIAPPTKLVDVQPVYPAAAKEAKIQGVVILEAVIGTNGQVEQARVLRSVPELDQAAIDAVKQWVFTPTQVNGKAVKVIMTVTVNFTLQ